MYHLNEGQVLDFNTENTEACFVLVSGFATISVDDATFENLGNRHSPFEKIPIIKPLKLWQTAIWN